MAQRSLTDKKTRRRTTHNTEGGVVALALGHEILYGL